MEYKKIVKYHDNGYCVLIPKYYEHETAASWVKYFVGSKKECETVFSAAPDYMFATHEENIKSRYWKMKEYLFLLEIGKTEKANKIKLQYGF